MAGKSENIRIICIDLLFLMLLLVTGLLICSNSDQSSSFRKNNSVSSDKFIDQGGATILPTVRVAPEQKCGFTDKDFFELTSLKRIQLLENKKTLQKISAAENIRKNILRIPSFIIQCHLFHEDKEHPPLLS